jgi:hypothetical protein
MANLSYLVSVQKRGFFQSDYESHAANPLQLPVYQRHAPVTAQAHG